MTQSQSQERDEFEKIFGSIECGTNHELTQHRKEMFYVWQAAKQRQPDVNDWERVRSALAMPINIMQDSLETHLGTLCGKKMRAALKLIDSKLQSGGAACDKCVCGSRSLLYCTFNRAPDSCKYKPSTNEDR